MRKYDYTWKSTKIFIFCFLLNVFFILLLGLQLSAFIYFLIQTLKIWLNLLWFLSLLITFFFKFVLLKESLKWIVLHFPTKLFTTQRFVDLLHNKLGQKYEILIFFESFFVVTCFWLLWNKYADARFYASIFSILQAINS